MSARARAAAKACAVSGAWACGLLLSGCHESSPPQQPVSQGPRAANVTAARLAAADQEPGEWFLPSRDAAGSYYSPLTHINQQNVGKLGYAWDYRLGTRRGLEATPIVVDGVMYTVGNFGRVYALQAATGRLLWTYDPESDGLWARYACCDAVNRGVAVWHGRVYVGALDGWLHAIDAATGKRIWKVDTLAERSTRTPYTLTGAPLIAAGLIVIGDSGADFAGVRGYVSAFDQETGALRWRFYTVPRDPALGPQDQAHLEKALATWDPRHPWAAGSGGTVWDGMIFDADLNLVFVGTGNGAPYNIKDGGRSGGDDLYAASIIAIHADTGTLAWYYQTVPGDRWDYDSTQKMAFADLPIGGRTRPVLMQAAKNGFFYVLDRATGELLAAPPFAFANWTKGIDLKSGRPIPSPDADYTRSPKLVFPSLFGAHSWQPMSFDPVRRVAYIPVVEAGNVLIESTQRPVGVVDGSFTLQSYAPEDYDPRALKKLFGELPTLQDLSHRVPTSVRSHGMLRAFDPVAGRTLWEVPTASTWDGGVLSTAGGLVFQGDETGYMNAYAADSGTKLAGIALGSSVMAAPMSYEIAGVQYIAVMAGFGGAQLSSPFPNESAAYRYGNEGRIFVLKLNGGPVPLPPVQQETPIPKPPVSAAASAMIERGEILYARHCARCHVFGRGELPDLRKMSPATHAAFLEIVRQGVYGAKGMGRFDDILSEADASAIHDYLIHEAWRVYREGAR